MSAQKKSVNLTTDSVVNSKLEKFRINKNELVKLGLSQNQAMIYLFLIGHKELRIQKIVNLANIPRSSVYESLKVLHEFGLIEEVLDGNFKKYKPYPIGSIRHHLNEKLEELQKQVTEVDKLEKMLATFPENEPGAATIRHYKGVAGARQLFWNTLKSKDVVYVYSSWGRGRYVGMRFYENFVTESRK